jgi:hypothetical protein
MATLHFSCSPIPREVPIVSIMWEEIKPTAHRKVVNVTISIDKQVYGIMPWIADTGMIYKPIYESNDLVNRFETGNSLEVSWTDTVLIIAAFDLKTFNKEFSKFSKLCKLNN